MAAGTELGKAWVQIVPSAEGISGSIQNLLDPEADKAGKSAGKRIFSWIKKAGVGLAVGKLFKDALAEGGALQQSFGGLDTIYGDAAEGAKAYAKEAYKAGISANEWSEQAVSVGASLKQAYGDDALAMEAANQAILDMADNSAKMGTSIESIQNAYQGFAKQNYTMLDNLKLGYGGTKSEMERLLKDAQAITGVEYDIDNLGDVYEAIHVIQGELGIAGVAAKEAEGTLTGSAQAMNAAWHNMLGALMLGEDIGPAMIALSDSASTFLFDNLIPAVGRIIKSLPGAIVTFLKQGVPQMLAGFSDVVASIGESIRNFASGITAEKVQTWLTTTLPKMWSAADSLLGNFSAGLINNIGKIIAAIGKIGLEIIKGLGSAIWGRVRAAAIGVRDKFMEPINQIRDKVKAVIDKVKGFFPLSVGKIFSNIKIPKINISGGKAPWGIGGMGTKPTIDITWAAKGLILDKATLIGAGEAGREGIIPLTGAAMRPFAQTIASEMPDGRMDYASLTGALVSALSASDQTIVLQIGGKEIARVTAPYLKPELNRLENRNNRKFGYI